MIWLIICTVCLAVTLSLLGTFKNLFKRSYVWDNNHAKEQMNALLSRFMKNARELMMRPKTRREIKFDQDFAHFQVAKQTFQKPRTPFLTSARPQPRAIAAPVQAPEHISCFRKACDTFNSHQNILVYRQGFLKQTRMAEASKLLEYGPALQVPGHNEMGAFENRGPNMNLSTNQEVKPEIQSEATPGPVNTVPEYNNAIEQPEVRNATPSGNRAFENPAPPPVFETSLNPPTSIQDENTKCCNSQELQEVERNTSPLIDFSEIWSQCVRAKKKRSKKSTRKSKR